MNPIRIDISGPILDFKGKSREDINIRDALLILCGSHQTSDGKEAIAVFDLGSKIAAAEIEVELTGDEFELLKKVVKRDPPQFTALVMGPIHKLLS